MKQIIFNLCDKYITKIGNATTAAINAQQHPCPQCGSQAKKLGVGKGPHSASLRCGECDRFIKWISKAQLIKIQNQGGQV
jgi:hypothetical protein